MNSHTDATILLGLILLLAGMISLHFYARFKDRQTRQLWRERLEAEEYGAFNDWRGMLMKDLTESYEKTGELVNKINNPK